MQPQEQHASELLDDYEEGKIAAPVVKIGYTVHSAQTVFLTRIGRKLFPLSLELLIIMVVVVGNRPTIYAASNQTHVVL